MTFEEEKDVAERACSILRGAGYSADWEFPGFIHASRPGSPVLVTCGTANGDWGCDIYLEPDLGLPIEHHEPPIDLGSSPGEIGSLIARAHAIGEQHLRTASTTSNDSAATNPIDIMQINTPELAKKHLNGKAMPEILRKFREQVIGRKIKDAGYITDEEGAWPYLLLDGGVILYIQQDDEGNGPGSITTNKDVFLCETSPIKGIDVPWKE